MSSPDSVWSPTKGMRCKRSSGSSAPVTPGSTSIPRRRSSPCAATDSVAGTGKRFEPRQRKGSAESIAVQMRDAKGAAAEAKRQFRSAFAPCPAEPKCATGIELRGPRVPGAVAVEIRHKVDGDVFFNTTNVFTKSAFVYQVFASGARINERRDELIDAAQALYERVPVDRPSS